MSRITKAQQVVLDEMKRPGARALFMPGLNAYWFITTTHQSCTRQIEALIRLGLVKITERDFLGRPKEAIVCEENENA